MNEHTQRLLRESTYYILGVPLVDQKKFAELIVRECMDIAKQVENEKFEVAGSAEPEYRTGINDGRRNAAWGIKNRMKIHFGVEE
jgi:hypothetical protein